MVIVIVVILIILQQILSRVSDAPSQSMKTTIHDFQWCTGVITNL